MTFCTISLGNGYNSIVRWVFILNGELCEIVLNFRTCPGSIHDLWYFRPRHCPGRFFPKLLRPEPGLNVLPEPGARARGRGLPPAQPYYILWDCFHIFSVNGNRNGPQVASTSMLHCREYTGGHNRIEPLVNCLCII